jgi:hypothetical protein
MQDAMRSALHVVVHDFNGFAKWPRLEADGTLKADDGESEISQDSDIIAGDEIRMGC